MKAMILAAGRGERMRPLTDHEPKPLLEVGGKPLIVHTIESLARAGFTELVINLSYRAKQIREALGGGENWGVSIAYSDEGPKALETGGGIHHALPLLGDAPFLVTNGDIWTRFPYQTLAGHSDALAHLVLVNNPAHHPDGDFALEDGRVILDGQPRYTFSGIGVYHPDLFRGQSPGPFPLAPLLRVQMAQGAVTGELYRGPWTDVGTPQRLQALDQKLS